MALNIQTDEEWAAVQHLLLDMRNGKSQAPLAAPACCAALTESMAHIANKGFCVVLKCLPDGFPWLDDEAKPIVCKKWAAEAQWVKHGDEYRMREHAIGDTPEEVVGKLETLIAEQSMRHNARADLPRIDDMARESGCEGDNRG